MAVEDAMVQNFIIYHCGYALVVVGTMWFFRKTLKYYVQQKLFAYIMNRLTKKINKGLRCQKKSIFNRIHQHNENVKGDLLVLEVGAGSAANLSFLPKNCRLTLLDPNPHFEGYIKRNLGRCDTVVMADIVQGFAEDIPIEDDTFDVVICTLVLCCVSSVEKSLAEIKRVLKPGGLFVFIEHVAAERGTWTWTLQGIADPFHRMFGDGCNTRRETANIIKQAGFKDLKIKAFNGKSMPIWVKPCIMGSASK